MIYHVKIRHVVVVYPLLPACWGESVSVVSWGFAASFSRQSSSRVATPERSLHKSRADSVACNCGQLKRCCVVCPWVRQRGQSGDGCVEASIVCRNDRRKGIYLFLVGLGYDACAGVTSLQCCWLAMSVCAVFCYCLLQQGAEKQCLYVCRACLLLCMLWWQCRGLWGCLRKKILYTSKNFS